MQISSVSRSEIMVTQGQSAQSINQGQTVAAPRINWWSFLTTYKFGEKGYLAREFPQTGMLLPKHHPICLLTFNRQALLDILFPATYLTYLQKVGVESQLL